MKRLSEILIIFLLLTSPLYGDELSDCYKQLRKTEISPDKALDRIFVLEKSPSRIIEAVNFCSARITDKYRFYRATADLAHVTGNLETACSYYERAYGVSPKSYDNLYMAGVIYHETGKTEQAEKMFGIVAEGDTGTYGRKATAMKGALLFYKGDNAGGKALLDAVLAGASESSEVYLVYDIATVYGIEDTRTAAEKKLRKSGFEGKLAARESSFPVTPSRIFIDSGYVPAGVKNEEKLPADADISGTEEEKTIAVPSAIQVGSFSSMENADSMKKKIAELNLKAVINTVPANGNKMYKVIIPVTEGMDVNNTVLLLKDNSIESYMIF